MDPITIGALAFAGLWLAKRAKTKPVAERAKETYTGVEPEPIPVVTSFPRTGLNLPRDPTIEEFLTQLERDRESVTTLTPEGQFYATGPGGAC